MSIEDLLAIGGFTASFAGLLIALVSLKQDKKLVAISILVALGVFSTGVSFYRSHQEALIIEQVEEEILGVLAHDTLTFDELHIQLLFRTFPEVKTALFRLILDKVVSHCLKRTKIKNALVSYRIYYYSAYTRNAQQGAPADIQTAAPPRFGCS